MVQGKELTVLSPNHQAALFSGGAKSKEAEEQHVRSISATSSLKHLLHALNFLTSADQLNRRRFAPSAAHRLLAVHRS